MQTTVNYPADEGDDASSTSSSSTDSSVTHDRKPSVVPRDSEGYHQSFKLDPSEEEDDESGNNNEAVLKEAKAFFDKHGFVIFRDVVSPQAVEEVVTDIWSNYLFDGIRRDDPTTWFLQPPNNWSSKVFGGSYNTKRGFLGYNIAQSQAAWNIRQNPSVYKAFAGILGKKWLRVKMDRYGLMRPTKVRVPDANGELVVEDHPEWKTEERWVHWDQNPWTEPKFRGGWFPKFHHSIYPSVSSTIYLLMRV